MYKRENFCGPAGDGVVSKFFSNSIAWILEKLRFDFFHECRGHDFDWSDYPATADDLIFARKVYAKAKKDLRYNWDLKYGKGLIAGLVAFTGFILVRGTAIVYKQLKRLEK